MAKISNWSMAGLNDEGTTFTHINANDQLTLHYAPLNSAQHNFYNQTNCILGRLATASLDCALIFSRTSSTL